MAYVLNVGFAEYLTFNVPGPFAAIRDSAGLAWAQIALYFTYMILFTVCALLVYFVPKLYKLIFNKAKKEKNDA
ncbi:MAG: hypothetical protein FWE53_03160 [Firmicutes bacterium]|nr:hypothetical protein [Bacillota bacterium]